MNSTTTTGVTPGSLEGNRVLLVTTSHDELGDTGYSTGFWLSELTHPFFELHQAGAEIDIASIEGGEAPIDPLSDPNNPEGLAGFDYISAGFLAMDEYASHIEDTMALADADLDRYDALLFTGGNGAMYDYAQTDAVAEAGESIYSSGKILGAMCHGSAALLNMTNDDGTPLIEGHEVTGFSNEEEKAGIEFVGREYLPFYLEDELPERGATYRKADPYTPFMVVSGDGRLITGQQQNSGALVGREIAERLAAQSA